MYISFQSNIHPYNTRSSSRGNFFVQYSRLGKLNKSFSWVGVRVWNSLPVKMHHTSKTNFKCKIHNLLLKNSRRQMITFTYLIWLKTENILYYICIIYIPLLLTLSKHSCALYIVLCSLNISTQSNEIFLYCS